jgi:hypothetical protein
MAATPLEQLVVALATYWTDVLTVLLLAGADTQTPANALEHKVTQINGTYLFMQ